MKRKAVLKLLERLQALIKPAEDDIRCYRLPDKTEVDLLGKQFFPEDIMLFTDGINQLLSQVIPIPISFYLKPSTQPSPIGCLHRCR
ncbi:MAG: CRISPR-associated endonuclease Cas2 [Methylococcales bacterium]